MSTRPSRDLQTFANPKPERPYEIRFETPELTCLCPLTGQPDFATLRIRYVPDQLLLLRAEMKVPGRAWLELAVEPDGDGSIILSKWQC